MESSSPHGPSRSPADRLMLLLAVGHCKRLLRRLMRSAATATRVQDIALLRRIRRNADSVYGRDNGFGDIASYSDFVRRIPITRYEDLEPYVERVKAGEPQAMFGGRQRVLMFAKTSGTTDKPKYVPVTTSFLQDYRRGWNAFGVKAIMDHDRCFLRHIVQVTSPMDEEISSGGYMCGAITGLMAATQKRLVRRYYISPPETGYIDDAIARYYAIMRFAVPADVAFMITASPATQLRLVRTADTHAEMLIRDVRDGTLSAQMNVPAHVRAALERRIRPNREAAAFLESVVRRTGRLLPKDYWRLGFLANWTGGTMGLHLHDFPDYFGSTPVRDVGLLASEGRMSIPVEDGTASGILDVESGFFEFIPADEYGHERPTVLRCHELEVGQEYFILLTTSAGFYRYDIGDCVRVTGYCGEAPLIEFLHKGLHISSLTGEKLTEQQVVLAFDRAVDQLAVDRTNFVMAPAWADPPRYTLHVEPTDRLDELAVRKLAHTLDDCLQQINVEYASKRRSGRLDALRLNLLPARWLTDMDQERAGRQRRANEQYKHRYLYTKLGEDASFPGSAAMPSSTDAGGDPRDHCAPAL